MDNRNAIFEVSDAKITYRNFAGEARQYNNAGNRNFNLILRPEDAQRFSDAGFRIRERPPRNEDEAPLYLMAVNVSYKFRRPRIVLIRGRKKVELTEETVSELDYADIEHIDLTIRPYHWRMPDGRTGVKAYLNSMYVTLVTDPYEDKYCDNAGSYPIDEDEPF